MPSLRQPPKVIDRPYIDEMYLYVTGLESKLNVLSQMSVKTAQSAAATAQSATAQAQSIVDVFTSPSALATAVGGSGATGLAIQDAYANLLTKYPAANFQPGTLFEVSSGARSGLWYVVNLVAGVRTWQFAFGLNADIRSTIAGYSLGTNDANALFHITDYAHFARWSGTAFRLIDGQGGYIVDSTTALGSGYQLCDGTATDFILDNTSNLAVSPITTPNENGNPNTYHGSIAAYTGTITGATAPAFSGTAGQSTGNDGGGGTIVQSGTGTTVAAHTHTHLFTAAGTITLPADPIQNIGVLRYLRR